jgi:hypothetical protein
MIEKKLYVDDRDIPYSTTKISPINTKSDIDAILAKWGVTKVAWEFDLPNNHVAIHFQLPLEKFQDINMNPIVHLEPPRIWNKRTRQHGESINWQVSMRILHWFIKDTLAMSYAMQSQKVVAFLPHIQTDENTTVKDVILPKLSLLKALPSDTKVIDAETLEQL